MASSDRFRRGARTFTATLGALGALTLAACDGSSDGAAQAPAVQAAAEVSASTATAISTPPSSAGTPSTADTPGPTAPPSSTAPSSTAPSSTAPSSTAPSSTAPSSAASAVSTTAVPVAPSTTLPLAQDSARIAQAQRLLLAKGYAIGEADGAVGPLTNAAVGEFQRSAGLSPSGTLDETTFAALERSTRQLQDELPAWVVVDLSEQQLYVHNKAGQLVTFWPISTGGPGNETPTGSFNVVARQRVGTAKDAETVHMDFFTVFNGHIGFHGIPWVGSRDERLWTPLGQYGVSHGCIRMEDANAEYLYTFLADGAVVTVQD